MRDTSLWIGVTKSGPKLVPQKSKYRNCHRNTCRGTKVFFPPMIFPSEVSLSESDCNSSKLCYHWGLTRRNIADPAQRNREFASIKLHLVKLLGLFVRHIWIACISKTLSHERETGKYEGEKLSRHREWSLVKFTNRRKRTCQQLCAVIWKYRLLVLLYFIEIFKMPKSRKHEFALLHRCLPPGPWC